jgi:short-subunit dehydrogenase
VINNAGIMQVGFTENASEQLAEIVMKVNYMSNMYIIKEFLPEMIKRDEG